MKATKRLLALFLCLVMLFTTVPVEAFATGEDTSGETALNETPNQDNGNGEQAGAEEPAAQSEEATGKIIRAYLNPTKDDGNGRIYVDLGNVHYNESVELKLYSGEALLTTATLNTTEFPAPPRTFKELTGSICMVAGKSDTWPNTEWIASEDAVPDKIELVVDGIVVDTIGKIQAKRDGGEMTAEDWIAFPNTLQMHTVTYTDGVDGEEIFADQKYTVEVGKETPAFEGTPARKGYNFIGWSSEVSDTVTGSVTYVAQWKAITYSIMYNAGEGSYVGPALSSGDNWMLIKNGYTYDAPVTLYGGEDFVRPGYTLVGWIVQGETYALGQTIERNFHTVQNGTVQAYAIWQANTYTIKYNAGEGAYVGSEPNSGDDWMLIKNGYTYDAPVTLHSGEGFVRDGYTLVGWIIDDEAYMAGQTVEKNFDTVQGGTVQAYAIWSANTYTIKYNAGEGMYVGTDLNRNDKWLLIKNGYTYDAPVTLYNGDGFVRPGYELLGWIIDEQTYALGQTVEINFTKVQSGTVQAYAVWNANQYTVSYNTNGGAAVADKGVTFDSKYGIMPTSSVTGLSARKNDWYLVDKDGNVTDINIRNTTVVSVARDHTLFLMRDVLAPTLKITLEVPGAISNDYKYYVPGNSTRVLTVTVNNKNEDVLNYSYQWYKDGAPIEGATEAVLTLPGNVSDSGKYKVVVTATLKDGTGIVVKVSSASGEKEQKVQIMRAANTLRLNENHGETPVTSDSYFGGAEFTIRSAAKARTGYTFLGWNTEADGSGTMYQAGDIAEFPGDNGNGGVVLELFAQWKANTYTVTLNANGGTVEPATLTATFEQPIGKLPVPVKPGYTFVGWTVEAVTYSEEVVLVDAETIYDLDADVTLIAVWNVNNYTLTLDANGGKADKDSVAVTYDAVIGELPVPTRTGYTFAGWFDAEGKEITAETVYTVAGDSTATAKWTVNTYKITLDPKGGDLKKGEETVEVTFGEAVGVLPIPSRTGYIFVGWFDAEDKEVTKDTIYELTEDTTLVAKWYVHKPADPSSPPTGDGMTMFVMASMLISAGALLFLLERKRRVQA